MSHIVEYIQYKRTITITSDLKLSQCSAGVEIVLMGPGKKTVTLVLASSSFTPVTFALLQWTHTCGDDLTAYVKETPKEKPVDFFLAKSTGKWQAFAALMVDPTRASKNCGVSVVPGLNEEINPRNQALSRESGHSVRSNSHRGLWFGLFKVRLRTKSNFYQHNYLVRPSRVWHRYKAHKGSAMCIERRGKAATPAEEEKKIQSNAEPISYCFQAQLIGCIFCKFIYIYSNPEGTLRKISVTSGRTWHFAPSWTLRRWWRYCYCCCCRPVKAALSIISHLNANDILMISIYTASNVIFFSPS